MPSELLGRFKRLTRLGASRAEYCLLSLSVLRLKSYKHLLRHVNFVLHALSECAFIQMRNCSRYSDSIPFSMSKLTTERHLPRFRKKEAPAPTHLGMSEMY